MKRIMAYLLVILALLTLVGCGVPAPNDPAETDITPEELCERLAGVWVDMETGEFFDFITIGEGHLSYATYCSEIWTDEAITAVEQQGENLFAVTLYTPERQASEMYDYAPAVTGEATIEVLEGGTALSYCGVVWTYAGADLESAVATVAAKG